MTRRTVPLTPAILLDRDGVIIENRPDYVRTLEQVRFIPAALAALAALRDAPYRIVIVTNQSGVGRGQIAPATADAINEYVVQGIVAAGGRIDGVYLCPHRPEDGCTCRKPQPGLLLQAARDLALDLPRSVLIGDALSDLAAGASAGVGRCVLVLSGRGRAQLALAAEPPPFVYEDLQAALTAWPGLGAGV